MTVGHSELKKFVYSLAQSYRINNIYLSEDIKQELWLKIIQLFPNVDLKEIKASPYLKQTLRNTLKDIQRNQRTRPDTSIYALCESQALNDIIQFEFKNSCEVYQCFSKPTFSTPEEALQSKELKKQIIKWSKTRDKKTQTFIQESLNPSPKIIKMWKESILACPRLKNYQKPPPTTLARFLGIPQCELQKILKILKLHLSSF